MKKDTLFLIIAALTLFIAWRTYRLHKKNNAEKTEPDTEPDNGGGNPNPNINPNIEPISPDNPEEPNTGDEEPISVTTTEKCPYCGTPGAEVTRIGHSLTGKMFVKTVMCPNKSCPGSMGGKVTPLAKSKSAKLVTAR